MIREAFHHDQEKRQKKDPTRGFTLVLLSVATSIDALAVGFSLSVIKESIWIPALVIGIVATMFTGIGLHMGKRVGSTSYLSRYADIIGAVVLFAIGLRILYEHGVRLDRLF
jgi:putative Mn2+ efflux pump MntP